MLPSDTPAQRTDANPFVRVAQPRGPGRWIPGIAAVRTYQRPWLVKDLTAGLVLTAILVPVGMGYAEAAGLPAIYGLYATIFPLIAYAIFGPSRILVLGPDSSLAAIIAATIVPLAGNAKRRTSPWRVTVCAIVLSPLTSTRSSGAGSASSSWPVRVERQERSTPSTRSIRHASVSSILSGDEGSAVQAARGRRASASRREEG